ncbi:MAG: hypothetical protein ACJ8GW_08470 [Massilia sp.]
MNNEPAQTGAVTHDTVQRVLPWMLSGTLDSDELERIAPHLENCAECQAELTWQRAIITTDDAAPGLDVERAFAALTPRLGPQEHPVSTVAGWRQRLAANGASLRWTVAAQMLVICGLAALLLRPAASDSGYHALGAQAAPAADAVITFDPATSEGEVRRILRVSGARLVDGPTVTDAYLLALPPADAAAALTRLRSEKAVTLVRPLNSALP